MLPCSLKPPSYTPLTLLLSFAFPVIVFWSSLFFISYRLYTRISSFFSRLFPTLLFTSFPALRYRLSFRLSYIFRFIFAASLMRPPCLPALCYPLRYRISLSQPSPSFSNDYNALYPLLAFPPSFSFLFLHPSPTTLYASTWRKEKWRSSPRREAELAGYFGRPRWNFFPAQPALSPRTLRQEGEPWKGKVSRDERCEPLVFRPLIHRELAACRSRSTRRVSIQLFQAGSPRDFQPFVGFFLAPVKLSSSGECHFFLPIKRSHLDQPRNE